MSKLKDKLSNNMKMAKDNQAGAPAKPAPTQAQAPQAIEPVSAPIPSLAPQVNPQGPANPPASTAPAEKRVPGDVPDSGSKLFPDRVWPD